MTEHSREPLDDLLARAAVLSDAELAHLDIGAPPRPAAEADATLPGSRRRRLLLGGAGVTLAAALVAGPAAANFLSARTGLFANGQEDGTGEFIDLSAPDARAVMAEHLGDHPLPPGETWAAYLDAVPEATRDSMVSESGLRQQAAFHAQCRWERAWLHNVPGAQAVIDDMPSWPEFHVEGMEGDGTLSGLLTRIAAETRRGESALLKQHYRVNCTGGPVTQR